MWGTTPTVARLRFLLPIFQLGKCVVARVAIPTGVPLSLDMLGVKVGEPRGVAPEEMEQLVGRMLKDGADPDASITASMLA